MTTKENFTQALFFLAEVSNRSLTSQMFDFYLKEFEQLDFDKATKAVLSFAKDCKWPSINQIKERMGLSPNDCDDDQKARLLAQNVVWAIGKFGWCNEKEAAEWFGDDWKLIAGYSPWSLICEIDNDGLSTFQAQFREYAKSYLHNQKYQNYVAIESKTGELVQSLLNNKMQKQIDNIPF